MNAWNGMDRYWKEVIDFVMLFCMLKWFYVLLAAMKTQLVFVALLQQLIKTTR